MRRTDVKHKVQKKSKNIARADAVRSLIADTWRRKVREQHRARSIRDV
jgi:hypothetical protein